MEGDWVCLHRKIFDSVVGDDPWLLTLFIYCISEANWKDGWFMRHPIKRGQFATSHGHLAAKFKTSRAKVQRGLKVLEQHDMVSCQNVSNRFTLITVCNYRTYQDQDLTNGQPASNQRATTEQPASTIEQGNKGTRKQKTPCSPPKGDGFDEFWAVVSRKEGKEAARRAWKNALKRVGAANSMTKAEAAQFITQRMAAFAKTPKGQSGQYCPQPSTWLNGGRYDDDPSVWQSSGDSEAAQQAKIESDRAYREKEKREREERNRMYTGQQMGLNLKRP